MKNFLKILALLGSVITAQAFNYTTAVNSGAGGTNTIVTYDLGSAATAPIVVVFNGNGDRNVNSSITVSNLPTANATFAITVDAKTTNYTWQTTAATTNYAYSASAPSARIGVVNAPNSGDTFTLITASGVTNVLTWTNGTPLQLAHVQTAATTGASATNLYNKLNTFPWTYKQPTIFYVSTNVIELRGDSSETWYATNSATWGTNFNSTYFSYTNATPTNSHQITIGTNAAIATTNLYNKLLAEWGTNLTFAYGSPSNIVVTTPSTNLLSATVQAAWGSVVTTSNAMSPTGIIRLVASNSVDGVNFVADPARTFTVPLNGYAVVAFQTNFTSLVYPILQYTLENNFTNYTKAGDFKFKIGGR